MFSRFALAAFFASLLLVTPAWAEEEDPATLHVAHGWARASLGEVPNSAAYVTIHNPTADGDTLTGVSCDVAERCELHNTMRVEEMLSMYHVSTMPIPAGAHMELRPGSMHVMMFDLKEPLAAGETFTLTFHFEKAGDVATKIEVLSLKDASNRGKAHKPMDHDKHEMKSDMHDGHEGMPHDH